MLLEELIEQHRVHRFVADGREFALASRVTKSGFTLAHFLHKAELWSARFIQLGLVMEGDWTQSQERLTGGAHIGDVRLEAARGENHAQLAVIIDVTGSSTRPTI